MHSYSCSVGYLPTTRIEIQSFSNSLLLYIQYLFSSTDTTEADIIHARFTHWTASQFHGLTLMSSKSRLFRTMLFLFHMIGGLSVPTMAQLRTALCPTVAAVMLTLWSSGRLNWITSAMMKVSVYYWWVGHFPTLISLKVLNSSDFGF